MDADEWIRLLQAIASGAIDILLTHLEAAYKATTSRKFLSQSCPSSVLLSGLQPLSPRAGPDSPLNSQLQVIDVSSRMFFVLSPDVCAAHFASTCAVTAIAEF